jgi:hypothetical protein
MDSLVGLNSPSMSIYGQQRRDTMDKSIIGDNPIQNYALIFYTLTEDTTIESNFACHYIYSYHFEPSNEVMQ